jgi:hypothetical protein
MVQAKKRVKASLHHPERVCTCMDCGVKFKAFGHADRCEPCRRKHLKEYQRKYIRPARRKARREREARAKAEMAELTPIADITPVVKKRTRAAVTGRCRFCGRNVHDGSLFCPSCMRDGFNEVYAVTGRTNGWDRKEGII